MDVRCACVKERLEENVVWKGARTIRNLSLLLRCVNSSFPLQYGEDTSAV
jgi:hypothetical protein